MARCAPAPPARPFPRSPGARRPDAAGAPALTAPAPQGSPHLLASAARAGFGPYVFRTVIFSVTVVLFPALSVAVASSVCTPSESVVVSSENVSVPAAGW